MLKGIKAMFGLNSGDGAAESAPVSPEVEAVQTASTPAEPIERGILRDCAAQRDAARQRVADIEAECDRLATIIAEGQKAADAMQSDLASDGGAALAAVVTGGKLDEKTSALVGIEMAARAATVRLPHAQAALEAAKAAAMRAEEAVITATRNLLLPEAGKLVAQYRDHFAAMSRLNEQIIGISYALGPDGQLGQELHNTVVAIEAPNFNVGAGSYSPTMRGVPDENAIARSTAAWSAARSALVDDPGADYLAILDKPAAPIVGVGSAPPGVVRGVNPLAEAGHGDGVGVNNWGLPISNPHFRF